MGSLTDAGEVDVLNLMTGQTATIFPLTVVALRLTSTTPTDSAAGTELTNTDYDPIDTIGDWAAPTSGAGTVANNAVLDFGTATETWPEIVGFELWTALTGGTRFAWGTLTTPKTPENGDPVTFPIGALVITAG